MPAATRLSADEAWALALGAFDEAETVCVTDEILEAVAVASPVWESGDKIGARMAFKSAYERIAGERRQSGQAPVWRLSLGWDGERRTLAAQEALRLGRMTADQVRQYLPAPTAEGPAAAIARLLSGKMVAFPVDDDALTRKRLAQLRAAINGGESRQPASDPVAEREARACALPADEVRRVACRQVCRFVSEYGGQYTYIPKADALRRTLRDLSIWGQYDGTTDGPHGIRAIGRQHRLSEVAVYNIVRVQRRLFLRQVQEDSP